ncbi:hypothetical protein NEPAR06_2045 [Nematocida parisii]|nr:hypothetical protein NEPAR07_1648 [Nematocida parisii]KAI5155773.1 hypothetical protein NEPAR06_2045 [Nematocida parisii]KAI5157004.1 hypothetical protein NEPAR05_0959 [Nematocida parisii]
MVYQSKYSGEVSGMQVKITINNREAVQIIKFFIAAQKSKDVKETRPFSGPFTMSEIRTGDFIRTPSWLIKSYIYEYLETLSDLKDFIAQVYRSVSVYIHSFSINQKEEKNHANVVYNYLFHNNPKDSDFDVYMNALFQVDNIISKYKGLLAEGVMELAPTVDYFYVNTPLFQYRNFYYNAFIKKIKLLFSTLSACFLYDPKNRVYNTTHIPRLNVFLKSVDINSQTSFSYSSDAILGEYIESVHDRIALIFKNGDLLAAECKFGLFQLMESVQMLTKVNDKNNDETIQRFSKGLNDYKGEITDKFIEYAENCILNILLKYSINKCLLVKIEQPVIGYISPSSPIKDLFCNLILTYSESRNRQTRIAITLKPGNLDVSTSIIGNTPSMLGIQCLNTIKKSVGSLNTFPGSMIAHYITIERDRLQNSTQRYRTTWNDIYQCMPNQHESLDALLIYGEIFLN